MGPMFSCSQYCRPVIEIYRETAVWAIEEPGEMIISFAFSHPNFVERVLAKYQFIDFSDNMNMLRKQSFFQLMSVFKSFLRLSSL